MKISEEKRKAYEEYLNSPKAKIDRFLDSLEEERLAYEVKSAKKWSSWKSLRKALEE